MVKIVKDGWAKHKEELKAKFEETFPEGTYYDSVLTYANLVEIALAVVVGPEMKEEELDYEKLHEIDDGDYQGTLLFLIPFKCYEPSHHEYLMTTMWYGSCSGCDALKAANTIEDLMNICETILCNLIKPYNSGWYHDEAFDEVNEEE